MIRLGKFILNFFISGHICVDPVIHETAFLFESVLSLCCKVLVPNLNYIKIYQEIPLILPESHFFIVNPP
jgi:hypothetical protein